MDLGRGVASLRFLKVLSGEAKPFRTGGGRAAANQQFALPIGNLLFKKSKHPKRSTKKVQSTKYKEQLFELMRYGITFLCIASNGRLHVSFQRIVAVMLKDPGATPVMPTLSEKVPPCASFGLTTLLAGTIPA